MTDVSSRNFGYLIAYVIPGFIVVASLSVYSPIMRAWIGTFSETAPTVSGFLYVTLASVFAGMTLSAVRWLTLDSFHHRTGIKRPRLDFSVLDENRAAFDALALNHFRYYEFFSHTALALIVAMCSYRPLSDLLAFSPVVMLLGVLVLEVVLFVASRDSLRKYYDRTSSLLGRSEAADFPDCTGGIREICVHCHRDATPPA